ncbi:receptor-type adenylate cyclase GRESAG [Trypanosoma brucei gambiense DAL972]|uniref:adenylate cyclase n=1 Tax=Trypanosoma brucei gambiense (strain MHOM/CI/86/DAL972) TaxID=679716 RepID=D0A7A0_TRYB9|nr:receptor-type adenylate cyclase GRESAG [Trypanosoma brucei gambiense DAL972]CBH17551.1 receptor-type adenylate cyclase GRESAG [Trypanosoma brucei gambiense DAL972]|eukprot:XP_011779815.1 receptor-type adenylate cyclase GRESAG [Trypanosoma brucei gambiense DAL972]
MNDYRLCGGCGAVLNCRPASRVVRAPPLVASNLPRPFTMAVALLALLSVGVRVAAGAEVTVNILYLMYNPKFPKVSVDALSTGFEASLAARRGDIPNGVKVSVIRPSSHDQPIEELFESAVEASKGKLLIAVGPLGNDNVLWSLEHLKNNDVVAFSPLTYSDEARGWNRHLYFTTAEPDAELLTLIRYFAVTLRLSRLGFMYLSDSFFGKESHAFTLKILSGMGYELSGTFSLEGTGGLEVVSTAFDAEWEQFVNTRPLAVLLLGSPNLVTREFVRRMATDDRTTGVYVLAPSSAQVFLINTWRDALEESGRELIPGQLIISGVNPLPNHARFAVVKRFREEVDEYLSSSDEENRFAMRQELLEDDTSGELMLTGWITGEVVSRALRSTLSLTNSTAFIDSLYEQRRYLIDDLVVGDFGGDCDAFAAWQGAVCQCNQGGSVVYMKEVVDGFRLQPVVTGFLTWGASECSSAGVVLRAPLNGLIVQLMDNVVVYRASLRYLNGASALLGNGRIGERDRFFLHPLEATGDEAVEQLEQMRDVKVIPALFGVVNKEIMATENLAFIDPITSNPRMNRFNRNVIYVSPTLAQELYVLVQYISEHPGGNVRVVIRTHDADMILEVLVATLRTYGIFMQSKVIVDNEGSLKPHLPSSGDVFVIGFTALEVYDLAEHLDAKRGLRIFAIYPDVTLMYEELRAAFSRTPPTTTNRFVFATNQPHWAEENSSSLTVQAYHKAVPEPAMRTPMSLRGFSTARLMVSVLDHMEKVDAKLLADYFYSESTINVDDMRYGPFSDVDCIVNGVALASNCLSNYGGTNISVWSMTRLLDPATPPLQNGVTPTLVYVDENKLTQGQVIAIAIGSTLVALLLAALALVLYFTLRNARDNELAPREPTEPVTLVFTDIESSTAQWAGFPELMPDAVASHHKIIRSLMVEYNCYEVKTIGDSFMIACRSPFAAVQLVSELQRHFLSHKWETEVFDRFYHAFEEQRACDDKEYTPPTARLAPDVYGSLWNGLRVRVGVHTGLCDIRYDEVTKGYDYYGGTTNMAARTESVANGGQVLLTRATYLALSEDERKEIDVVPLGLVALRGAPQPVELYQLNAVPGRTFAALRLDREYYFDEGGDGTTITTSDHSSSLADLSESAQMIASSLEALLSTFKVPQREKLLRPYCERWRVPLPNQANPVWDDVYCGDVIRRIAAKVGRVVDHSANGNNELTTSTHSTSVIYISNRCSQLDECFSADQPFVSV